MKAPTRLKVLGGVTVAFLVSLVLTSAAPSASAAPKGSSGEESTPPVTLSAATGDLARVKDSRGNRVKIVALKNEASDERAAVALTTDNEPVLLRALYAPKPKTPESAAVEPGLDDWVEGVTYFTDDKPQTSEEVIRLSDVQEIDPATLELAFSTATAETSFSAAWTNNGTVKYDVLRDGRRVATTGDGWFVDTGLKSGQNYTYSVRPAKGERGGDEKTFQVHTLEDHATETIAESSDPIAALAMKPVASWFMYNTFITDRYVAWDLLKGIGGECAGVAGDKYGGDNRNYFLPQLYADPWNVSHRTGARMKIDFGPNVVTEQKHVGQTRLYNSSGSLKASRTATTDGIVFSERRVSSSLYQVKLSHSVGNPFCNKGAIRYTVYLNTWSSGVMQVNGYRHPVPAHEAYGLFMNSAGSEYWATMYRGAQGDFFCISGTCPTQPISKTHTPT